MHVGQFFDRNFSVGKINIIVNGMIYIVCALMFDLETAVYCIIYAAISSFTVDRELMGLQ